MDDEVTRIGRVSSYVRIAKAIIRVLGRAGVPRFFSRYSNRVYDAWRHITLLAIRQMEGKSYRRFVEWLRRCRPLLRFLSLGRVPHYTTLQKYAARMPSDVLDRVLRTSIREVDSSRLMVGVDASGFNLPRLRATTPGA